MDAADLVSLWERTNCVIVDPDPNCPNPYDGEDVITFPGRGKIAKPPPAYHAAVEAVDRVPNPVYRWWLRWKVEGMNKCPLIQEGKCYLWQLGEKHISQLHFVRGYKPNELVEIQRWLNREIDEWNNNWTRTRTVGWTQEDGKWRGPLDRESQMMYARDRQQRGDFRDFLDVFGLDIWQAGTGGMPLGISGPGVEDARLF
ncbi:hypothetical protein E2P81_ATG03345 [Venturia nashicola]|nr:hypothetical protein E2P81_ATG03345 [Venturia nashicola]